MKLFSRSKQSRGRLGLSSVPLHSIRQGSHQDVRREPRRLRAARAPVHVFQVSRDGNATWHFECPTHSAHSSALSTWRPGALLLRQLTSMRFSSEPFKPDTPGAYLERVSVAACGAER